MTNPYNDVVETAHKFTRTFSAQLDTDELVWHRDRANRRISVVSGDGWKFQNDNQLPVKLSPGDVFTVEQHQFHRLLQGHTDLVLEITEFDKLNQFRNPH